jgi:hypothetical protein
VSRHPAVFRHSVGVRHSYPSCSGFHSTSSSLSCLTNRGPMVRVRQCLRRNGSSRLFVRRSLCVRTKTSGLRLMSGRHPLADGNTFYLGTERTSVLTVKFSLQHFLDHPDFVHAIWSACDDRSPPQDTLAKVLCR